jgi:dihydroneopterin aldolase
MTNQSHPFCDRIHIEQLEVFTHIGVPETERATSQRLTVNITFSLRPDTGDLGDHIDKTVNYSAVAEEVKSFAHNQSLNLVETFADRLAMHLLKTFPMQNVTIEVRKFPFKDAKYVSVTVTRIASVG